MENMGGLIGLLLIPESNLKPRPDVCEGTLMGDVEFYDAAKNIFVRCWENGSITHEQVRQMGSVYRYAAKVYMPGGNSGRVVALQALDNEPCLVLATDANRQTMVLGAYDALALTTARYSTGQSTADANGWELEVNFEDAHRAPYTTQLVVAGPDYRISTTGVLRPTGPSTDLVIGPDTMLLRRLLLHWREAGNWRYGEIAVLKDGATLEVAFEENSSEALGASVMAPEAALVGAQVVISLDTTNVDIIYYQFLVYA